MSPSPIPSLALSVSMSLKIHIFLTITIFFKANFGQMFKNEDNYDRICKTVFTSVRSKLIFKIVVGLQLIFFKFIRENYFLITRLSSVCG